MANGQTKTIDHEQDTPEHEIIPPVGKGGDLSPMVAAEINQQVATAKRFPRRRDKEIMDEIMGRATIDEETASECLYNVPRGDKDIIGPSIRFAEIVAAAWGNLRVGSRFVEIDTRDPKRAAVIIEGVCLDLQTNNAILYPIRRSIVTRKGGVFGADMTNIAFLAGSAIARREAVLKTVPKVVWRAAFQRVLSVVQGDASTIKERRAKVLAAFDKIRVDRAKLYAVLGIKDENDITIEHMPRLMGMLNAVKEGTETAESIVAEARPDFEPVKNPLNDKEDGDAPEIAQTQAHTDTTTAAEQKATRAEEQLQGRDKERAEAAKEAEKPKPKPVPSPLEAEKPKMPEYVLYAEAWINAGESATGTKAKTGAELKGRWAAERTGRNRVASLDRPLDEDEFTTLQSALNRKAAELDAATK